MNYEEIPVEDVVNAVSLAALSGIVHELQKVIQNDRELSTGPVSDMKGF